MQGEVGSRPTGEVMRHSLANTPLQAAIGYAQWHLARGIGYTKVAEMMTAHQDHGTVLSPAEREEAMQEGMRLNVGRMALWTDLQAQLRAKRG